MSNFIIEFSAEGQSDTWLGYGWSPAEPTHRWAIGGESELIIAPGVEPENFILELDVDPFVSPPRLASQRLIVSVNDEVIQEFVLSGGLAKCVCEVPARLIKAKTPIVIVFKHPDAARPCDLGVNADNRTLSVAFKKLSFYPADDLIPPAEMLFDGSTNALEFRGLGEGFTRDFLIEWCLLKPYERVLDIGSGNGQKARALSSYLDARGSYEGLDIARKGIDWCQTHYARFPNFRFQLADVFNSTYNPTSLVLDKEYKLPFTDNEFDLVFLVSVFTHMMPDGVAHYISEISRVLKPNGRCVATFFLLNDKTIKNIEAGQSSIPFPYCIGNCRVNDNNEPAAAVALDERWVNECFLNAGMRVVDAKFGMWSDYKVNGHLQDALKAVKL